ncbi:hypothetical protein E3J48_08235 [Candidatus Aerophobetes bacterium]|uniref:Uncharacterized protein n=1 Tax=Aerophobetes bacterium TaxID=2030807 RepID=A0A523VWG8_UNCAE|nr:MAG: hypothetical protein E3J48_08235 [Candidatus Aerophobetes bacterium]
MMKQGAWRIGWYSKVALTVIAVCLVGLLVRQLPRKVEAKPKWRAPVAIVNMAEVYKKGLAAHLDALSQAGELPVEIDRGVKGMKSHFNEKELRNVPISQDTLLEWILQFYYTEGYRIGFITGDLIILEAE